MHYRWLKSDPSYKERFAAAGELAVQYLEDVAVERATRGMSDTMLILLLKARRPQKYRGNIRQEHVGVDSAPLAPPKIEIVMVPTPKVPDRQ